jgi:hypothetical protein
VTTVVISNLMEIGWSRWDRSRISPHCRTGALASSTAPRETDLSPRMGESPRKRPTDLQVVK